MSEAPRFTAIYSRIFLLGVAGNERGQVADWVLCELNIEGKPAVGRSSAGRCAARPSSRAVLYCWRLAIIRVTVAHGLDRGADVCVVGPVRRLNRGYESLASLRTLGKMLGVRGFFWYV